MKLDWFTHPNAMMRRAYAIGVGVGLLAVILGMPLYTLITGGVK